MRISDQEQASQLRMASVQAEISRALIGIVEQHPDLTYTEYAIVLMEVAQRKLMHQRRGEVARDEDAHGGRRAKDEDGLRPPPDRSWLEMESIRRAS